ncbi:unnamed protein product [Pseudo-nitzschia multistriata]|uniref:Fe2OG dioxygenase domain-containing protein n=1 Tax=Pseudo-nitzschia multistriata TaxID=183589 RepID=A0A448Z9R2_9STRA|nr:unnamed protein product [Pseudo-nitzschia multistriata]
MEHQDDSGAHSFHLTPRRIANVAQQSTPELANAEVRERQEQTIAEAFANDGFFVLRQSLDSDALLPFRDFADSYFERCFRDLYDHGHISTPSHRYRETLPGGQGVRDEVTDTSRNQGNFVYTLQKGVSNGFREIVMRSPGRYELSLLQFLREHNEDKNSNEEISIVHRLDENLQRLVEPMKSLLPRLVGPGYTRYDELKLCHLSLLIATHGSSDQSWHADGGHASVSEHLPCHVFNVFFPLQDTPRELGPTELRPSSQFLTRNLGPMMLAARCRKTLRPPVWPELALGDAIFLDYRVLHRGRANRSGGRFPAGNRNYLVLTYSEPWFEDVLNFPKRSLYGPNEDDREPNAGTECNKHQTR